MRIKKYLKLKKIIPLILIGLVNSSNNAETLKLKTNKSLKISDLSSNSQLVYEIDWEEIKSDKRKEVQVPTWNKLDKKELFNENKPRNNIYSLSTDLTNLSSLNRSIVFDSYIVGPDISWLVPPGFSWSESHLFDFSTRGHNRRKKGEDFLGWNKGDAVGQVYIQPIKLKNSSFGLNLGIRSMEGSKDSSSPFGDGLSLGFRYDKRMSSDSGYAIGAEQLINFDGTSDTGRDIYLTFSKGWWKNKSDPYDPFPLITATAGFATGKMAEGNIKGLCTELFGGSGTEYLYQRSLCWAPVFSLAQVFNKRFSTFFEYNSYWFLLGTSIAPFEHLPARATFALQLSDHINNYKINSFEELKWVFRLSYGF